MTIETETYSIADNPEEAAIVIKGTLRLQGREQYLPIYTLLMESASRADGKLTLDMRGLIFLNSSGISAFSLFVIEMRKIAKPIAIIGSSSVTWQSKSLMNFQRLYEKVEITIE